MNSFVYDIPTKVYFGDDQIKWLGRVLRSYGKKVLLTYGGGSIKRSGLYQQVIEQIQGTGLEVFELNGVEPNPKIDSVRKGAEICKKEDIDVLLAIGGGSVIDCSKGISAAAFYDGDAWDLVVRKAPIGQCLPIVTILTLAATGSEMDAAAVISNPETKEKIGMGHMNFYPKASFLDPTLTYSVSPYQTACGSADILSHTFEIYFNLQDNLYFLDTVMEGLMKSVIKYAPIALKAPKNYEARANLMWASSWAINGFIRGGVRQSWSCHPMEHELSAFYDITHGLGLAILIPRWMNHVLNENTVARFYQYGTQVWGIDASLSESEVARIAINKTADFLYKELGLQQTLTEVGIDETHFEEMAEMAVNHGALQTCFQPLEKEDIIAIFKDCL